MCRSGEKKEYRRPMSVHGLVCRAAWIETKKHDLKRFFKLPTNWMNGRVDGDGDQICVPDTNRSDAYK